MFKSLWRMLREECSGVAAYQIVADISRYHRIQASPDFRRSAEYVRERLAEASIEAEVLDYPANTDTAFWGAPSFQEWDAHAGTLHLIEPRDQARKLADYREVPVSLIPRSVAFDGEAEVVAVDKGEEPAEYEGLDVAGKVVLTRGDVNRVYDLAVLRRGAVGIIFDGMGEVEPVRPAWTLPDAIQYTSFWWYSEGRKCFGFALSPREGERLRRLIRKRQEDGARPVRVRAHVDAHLYDGRIEVVSATIPGERDDEEIVVVGHLCHPRLMCNDNASGVAAMLEIARALQSLITAGRLARPRRTLRFLWVPEMSGTYAFLSTNEAHLSRMIAGLNLDMIGEAQMKCGSSFLLERPSDALPSFAFDLLARLHEMLLPEVKLHGELGGYPLSRYAISPFVGGSDHQIFSDPSVGVPMPAPNQWPDKFYHTTADTIDKVDPAMMGKVCVLSAAYAYWLAGAGEPEARWLASEMSARFRQKVIGMVQETVTGTGEEEGSGRETLSRRLDYQVERHQEALASLTRLAPVDTSGWQAGDRGFAEAEFARAADLLPQRPDDVEENETNEQAARLIPRRLFRGPLLIEAYVSRLDEAGRDEWWELSRRIREQTSRALPLLAQYWADGERTVGEIGRQIALETGLEATSLLVEYFRFADRLGLMELAETE